MKRDLLKRMAVLAMAVAMVFTMTANVFAANSDGTLNDDKGIETTDTTISIAKQIVFINAENTDVREPNIVYTYTISAAAPGTATVTDKDSITTTVKAGVMDAVSSATATVTFADTNTVAATANGTASASKYADFTFDASKFSAPGVYRYKITETCSPTKASVGVTEAATYAADRFLDVYVKKDADNNALAIYGYVLFEGAQTDSITSAKVSGGDVSMKSQGYVNASDTTGSQEDVDVYKTQNLYIEKTTTGSMADLENDFPITLTFTAASGVTAKPKLSATLEGNAALTGVASGAITYSDSMTGTVRNGSKITLTGIPEGTKVSLVETNNTSDSYKVKAGKTSGAADLLAEAIVAAGADSSATSTETLSAKVSIYVTNTLDAISPTNVVVRFAPYLFILAAATMLLLLVGRRKKEED